MRYGKAGWWALLRRRVRSTRRGGCNCFDRTLEGESLDFLLVLRVAVAVAVDGEEVCGGGGTYRLACRVQAQTMTLHLSA